MRPSSTSVRMRSRPTMRSRSGSTTSVCAAIRRGCSAPAASSAQTFLGVWLGELEDDRLNALVMLAGLSGRQITIIRAVLRYLRQAATAFSDRYMITTLLDNPAIAVQLAELFAARFDPDHADAERAAGLQEEITEAIDRVASLDEDRILRSLLAVLGAMLRTNYYRRSGDGRPPEYLSFKLDPTQLEMLPLPRPQVRDLRLFAAGRGDPPAGRPRRPRRPALVGPARGLPDRGAGADEGPDGQERADRPGRLQGRLRRQARRRASARPRGDRSARGSRATGRSCAACSTSPTTTSATT